MLTSWILPIILTLNFSFDQGDSRQDKFVFWWGTGGTVFESSADLPNADVKFGNGMQVTFSKAVDFGTKTKQCFAVQACNGGGCSSRSAQVCYQAPNTPITLTVTP